MTRIVRRLFVNYKRIYGELLYSQAVQRVASARYSSKGVAAVLCSFSIIQMRAVFYIFFLRNNFA